MNPAAPEHTQQPPQTPEAREETVLVTGGSGFLGSWCLLELLRSGYRVRTTVRSLQREAQLREELAREVALGDRLDVVEANLTDDAGWPAAVEGADYVLHVASPFPPAQPKDPDELIVPARDGTLRVLRASLAADVRRVVLTSSVAAVRNSGEKPVARALNEEDWTDASDTRLTPYTRSKTIAERAAWDFVRDADEAGRLAVVNPSAIVGPVLGAHRSYSLQLVERMLGGMPGLPRLGFSIVDVRDVAALQISAMTAESAAGERFIAAGPFYWFAEIAEILREHLGADARKVPSRAIPDWIIRLMARFDPAIRSVVGDLGQKTSYSSAKAGERLGWVARPVQETVLDCARSLLAEKRAVQIAA